MRRTFLKLIGLLLTAAILFTGCATIVSKSAYPVHIRATPTGASISITDKKGKEVYKGKSPATVALKSGAGYFSKAEYQVRLSSRGYGEKIVPIYFKLNGWYFGNLLFGGLIGFLIVDPATGAMWKIADPVIDETLEKTIASKPATPTLNIVDIADIPKELKSQLVRVN
jgi:hypothetical protein